MAQQLKKIIQAKNGDTLEVSFTLENNEAENVSVKVWNKSHTLGFDLTDLFEQEELYDCSDEIIQNVIYSL